MGREQSIAVVVREYISVGWLYRWHYEESVWSREDSYPKGKVG